MAVNRRGGFWWWPLCWASLNAVICAYLFFWSTFPWTPDEPPGQGTVVTVGFIAVLVYLLDGLSSIPLFLSGLFRLRRRQRLMIAWATAAAAGVVLEFLLLPFGPALLPGVPDVSPDHSGPAVLAWGFLALASGYLIVGAVLAHIAISAARTPVRLVPVSPTTLP
jgi:hypothetical protein